VFPDAALLEVGKVVTAMQGVGLEVRDVQSLREHYALTLRAWVANLDEHWSQVQRMVGPGRARVWRLYLAGSAVGFEQGRTSIHQVLAVRPDGRGRSGMPPTRAGVDVDAEHPVGS
jgi:cyclopropane-fatty-acyl-phospholipid synthase